MCLHIKYVEACQIDKQHHTKCLRNCGYFGNSPLQNLKYSSLWFWPISEPMCRVWIKHIWKRKWHYFQTRTSVKRFADSVQIFLGSWNDTMFFSNCFQWKKSVHNVYWFICLISTENRGKEPRRVEVADWTFAEKIL